MGSGGLFRSLLAQARATLFEIGSGAVNHKFMVHKFMVHNQVLAQAFAMECIPYGPYRLGSVTCWRKHSQFCAVYCNQVLGVRRLAQARET